MHYRVLIIHAHLDPHIFLGDPLVKMGWYDPAWIYPSRKGAGYSFVTALLTTSDQ